MDITDTQMKTKSIAESGKDRPNGDLQEDLTQKYIDEILQFIGRIHWKTEGIEKIQDFDPKHPLAPVFDAILHIKGYLDQSHKEHMQAEEELIKSEEKYKQIVTNIPDPLYFHDLNGTLQSSNFLLLQEFGYNENDLKNLNIRDIIPKKYRHEFKDYLKRIKKYGKDEGLMRVVTKSGSEHVLEYRNSC